MQKKYFSCHVMMAGTNLVTQNYECNEVACCRVKSYIWNFMKIFTLDAISLDK